MYNNDQEIDDAINIIRNASTSGIDYAEESELTTFMKQNANELGNKLLVVFYLEVFSTIISTVSTILQRITPTETSVTILTALNIISIAISISYLIMLFLLKKFDNYFGITAGITIINTAFSILSLISLFYSYTATIMIALIVSALSICGQYCFIQALRNTVGMVFVNLDESLQSFWKGYMIILCALIISCLCLCVPFLNIIALIVIIGLAIAAIVFSIWRLILIWDCATSMKNYAKRNMM